MFWFFLKRKQDANIVQMIMYVEETSQSTFTPWRTGSLLIMSINGGIPRGLPVVSVSPSTVLPYTFRASQRLDVPKTKSRE